MGVWPQKEYLYTPISNAWIYLFCLSKHTPRVTFVDQDWYHCGNVQLVHDSETSGYARSYVVKPLPLLLMLTQACSCRPWKGWLSCISRYLTLELYPVYIDAAAIDHNFHLFSSNPYYISV